MITSKSRSQKKIPNQSLKNALVNVHGVLISFSYQACMLIARLSIQGNRNTGEPAVFGRGGQGSHFSSAAYAAAMLPFSSWAFILVSPWSLRAQHFVSPCGKLGTGTHLATKIHPQNGGVIFLHSCHCLNLVCRLVIQTSAGTTGGAVRMGTSGELRK